MLTYEFKRLGIRISMNPVFLVILSVFVFSGYIRQFFIIFVCAALHEAGHMASSIFFGLRVNSLTISPLGFAAGIDNIDFLSAHKKCIIYLSGPLISFLIAMISFFFQFEFIFIVNMAFFVFNILPARALDGGRFLLVIISYFAGYMCALKVMKVLDVMVFVFIFATGIVQMTLYPLNVSLLCAGKYIYEVGKREGNSMFFRFLRLFIWEDGKYSKNRVFKVKSVAVSSCCPVKKLVYMLNHDVFYIFLIFEENGDIKFRNEREVMKYAYKNSLSGNAGDIF